MDLVFLVSLETLIILQDYVEYFRTFAFHFLLPKFILLELENAKLKLGNKIIY